MLLRHRNVFTHHRDVALSVVTSACLNETEILDRRSWYPEDEAEWMDVDICDVW